MFGKITIKKPETILQGVGNNTQTPSTKSFQDRIDNLPVNYQVFLTLLKEHGEIKAETFMKLLNQHHVKLQDTRELRIYKEDCIKQGFPVGSSSKRKCDFWIAKPKDLKDACAEYVSKARTMLQRANQLKQNVNVYYKRNGEQLKLFEIIEKDI